MTAVSNDTIQFTKIVATVAGNSCDRTLLQDLFQRGMNVVRLNTAHMSVAELERVAADVRAVSPQIAIMIDTKGPNIRSCGLPEAGLPLHQGEAVTISGDAAVSATIHVNYAPFAEEVHAGSRIVCDDGAAQFRVTAQNAGALQAEALFDCTVLNRKSINVPDVELHAPALTDRDREFLAAAVRLQCDLIAHSFVRNASDVQEVRAALGEAGREIGIIAKIENRQGVNNLDEILQSADGIMVARGDLGIEIPLEEVPRIQKMMIHKARQAAKPVITATQMLQSMENAPAPTRAEVSDVANAVYDGTDAVMLSGETAHGSYPREAVAMMRRIVMEAERAPEQFFPQLTESPDPDHRRAYLLAAAVVSAEKLPVKAIFCNSLSGHSARICSAFRPRVPIFASTPSVIAMRKLALNYGVFPVLAKYTEDPVEQAGQIFAHISDPALQLKGDDLVMLLGKHSSKLSRNDLLCLATVDELLKD